MYQDSQGHKHTILVFHILYKQERGNYVVVHHKWYDRIFYDQTTARRPVKELQEYDHGTHSDQQVSIFN